MAVTKNEVANVAKLAKLYFSEEELETFTDQFNQILSYVDKLNELDTDGIEPMTHVLNLHNVLRDDITIPSPPRNDILKNAPLHDDEYIKVPKVIKN